MRFQQKIKENSSKQIWQEYCGFMDLDVDSYMAIQNRLMTEQLKVWSESGLGKSLINGKTFRDIDDFRDNFPLTTYDDYADILLAKRESMLPDKPVIWIQTTWEGGIKPIKVAPYTRSMLDTYRHNLSALTILISAKEKGQINVRKGDRVLYGGAPLPYMTGLIPSLLDEDIDFNWLPSNDTSEGSFSKRIKQGFKMAMSGGVDYFFANAAVANYITESFSSMTSGGASVSGTSSSGSGSNNSKGLPASPKFIMRYLKAKYIAGKEERPIYPKDVFKIKGFVCTGADAAHYRERLTKAWGIDPIEIAAGTEATCIGSESLLKRGMILFPDACFYEFIPEQEYVKNLNNPSYKPQTVLTNEVIEGENYEIVLSVLHGGAFMRYRIGDVYHCVSASPTGELPRFTFYDRVPSIIDIASFTRITETAIAETVRLSKLGIDDWIARKEFDRNDNPYMHMYIEISEDAQESDVISKRVLSEHLSTYFKAFDSDYDDLKKLLNMEPLKITILKHGTIKAYCREMNRELPRLNASAGDLSALLRYQR
ncbi:MAG: GH3 auxin-responsive promoter family protein [Bacillota bacterium]|nr:GH3 auxin-responsive promoter family protein [Bacillota bacterium]